MDLTNVPANARFGLIAANAEKPLAQDGALEAALERYLKGESITAIAADIGIGHPALYQAIWRHYANEWPSIRACRAEAQYDAAIDKLADWETPLDGVTVNRAHVISRIRFGELQALRKQFAPKQEGGGGIVKVLILRDNSGIVTANVLDGQLVPASLPAPEDGG